VPQLFVYGANDKPNTVARVSEAKQKYPKLRLNLLPECGHLVQYDRRDEVVRLLDEFFGACLRNKP
jgi:pimeloyl-ACP methyl ester carboxylesterase